MTQPDTKQLPSELIKLGSYDWPLSHARQTLSQLFGKVRTSLRIGAAKDAINRSDLEQVTQDQSKLVAIKNLSNALQNMLDATFGDWALEHSQTPQRRAFIHPPTNIDALVEWGTRHEFSIVTTVEDLSGLPEKTCVVVPHLEHFFRRDYTQLNDLLALFDALAKHKGKVIVGCNSWAWRFLKQFDDALLLFLDAHTIPAFDASAISSLLEDVMTESKSKRKYLSAKSGDSVFERDKNGNLHDGFMEKIADLSLGHPEVAIGMFFDGVGASKKDEEETNDDATWLELPVFHTLPTQGADALLFALHVLMIQGPQTQDQLNALLPRRAPNGIWTELARIGFVDVQDGLVTANIESYPAIRSELGAAGYNLDRL